MEKHIYFVRHGESDANVDNVIRGADAKLTDLGREQARSVAKRITGLTVETLITSPFLRALETAQIIAEQTGLPLEINELFREWVEPTALHGKSHEEPHTASVMKIIHASEDDAFRHSDEETFAELKERGKRSLVFLKEHSAERICVVTHAGQMHVLIGLMIFGDHMMRRQAVDMLHRLRLTNTGITYTKFLTEYKGRGPEWHVITWNDQTHLE